MATVTPVTSTIVKPRIWSSPNWYDNTIDAIHEKGIFVATDLDGTLIEPPRIPIKPQWKWLKSGRELVDIHIAKKRPIIIFTNQGYRGEAQINTSIARIESFIEELKSLNCEYYVVAAYGHDKYRKPAYGMYEWMMARLDNIQHPIKQVIYYGDSAGRKKDYSDSDLIFASNIKEYSVMYNSPVDVVFKAVPQPGVAHGTTESPKSPPLMSALTAKLIAEYPTISGVGDVAEDATKFANIRNKIIRPTELDIFMGDDKWILGTLIVTNGPADIYVDEKSRDVPAYTAATMVKTISYDVPDVFRPLIVNYIARKNTNYNPTSKLIEKIESALDKYLKRTADSEMKMLMIPTLANYDDALMYYCQ